LQRERAHSSQHQKIRVREGEARGKRSAQVTRSRGESTSETKPAKSEGKPGQKNAPELPREGESRTEGSADEQTQGRPGLLRCGAKNCFLEKGRVARFKPRNEPYHEGTMTSKVDMGVRQLIMEAKGPVFSRIRGTRKRLRGKREKHKTWRSQWSKWIERTSVEARRMGGVAEKVEGLRAQGVSIS